MPTIPKFPFQIGGKGKSEGLIGKNILGNTMIAASNTLRKSLAKVATRRAPSSQKKQKRRPPMTYIPNENARNLPTFSINKESIKRPKEPSVDFGGFVPLTRRGPLMIEENYRRPTNRIPLRPNFQQRNSIETNVEVVSKGESGLEENPIILDLGKDRMKIVKEYESKKREAVIKNNSKSREDTNSTLSNFDYHPIMSFFNDY